MYKVLIAAPINPLGRFKGGIKVLVESMMENNLFFEKMGFTLDVLNTSNVKRSDNSQGKIRFKNILNFIHTSKMLRKRITNNEYDILHYHTSIKLAFLKDLLSIIYIRKKFKGKVILHIHYADIDKILFDNFKINKIIIKIMNKYLDKVIFLSEGTRNQFIDNGFIDNKASLIYNFYDVKFKEDDIIQKIKGVNDSSKKNILFLGSISKRKGILDLLKALKQIQSDRYCLNIAGTITDNDIEEEYRTLIEDLSDNIICHGYIEGDMKNELLRNADILVLPSYEEGLPLSILEGMAAGCIVISSDVGAITEVIKHEINGYIVKKPGDIKDLARLIEKAILEDNNDMLLNSIKEAENYTLEKFIDNTCKEYLI